MIIYKTVNILNNKIYVGQDSKNSLNYMGSGLLLKKAIKKYGKENFRKEMICECSSKEELDEKEKYWIKTLNCKNPNGYNITDGGEGGDTFSNNPNREIIRNKISKLLKIKHSGTGNPFYGKHLSDNHKLNISKSCIGKNTGDKNPMSNPVLVEKMKKRLNEVSYEWSGENNPAKRPEVRQKIRESKLGKRYSEESKKERKRRKNEKKYNCLYYFNTFNIFI